MSKSIVDILSPQAIREFIQSHLNEDPVQLVLQAKKYPDLPVREIAAQIQSRKKALSKLPEWQEREDIIFPHGVSMEQCSSEETAKYKASLVQGKRVVDLTGGFGIDLYYLSQQFDQAIYIEQNKELVDLADHNFTVLKAENIDRINATAEQYLAKEDTPADVYYIDPARRDESNQKVFLIEDCTPDLNLILPQLLDRKAEVLIKLSPLLDVGQSLQVLTHVKELHVVSVKNECKELLFRIAPDFEGTAKRIAVNLMNGKQSLFEFEEADEGLSPTFSRPLEFLYEPNASIMKAGGFNAAANAYSLNKLHRNSHLYTSNELVGNFPGRSFKIVAQTVVNKKKLKTFLPQGKANITVRNYPMTVKEIRKITGIKEGGDVYLFATTLMDGSLAMIVCTRV